MTHRGTQLVGTCYWTRTIYNVRVICVCMCVWLIIGQLACSCVFGVCVCVCACMCMCVLESLCKKAFYCVNLLPCSSTEFIISLYIYTQSLLIHDLTSKIHGPHLYVCTCTHIRTATCCNPVYVHPHSKCVLMQAVLADTEFLAQNAIMDYSLLTCIDEDSGELVVGIIGTYIYVPMYTYTYIRTIIGTYIRTYIYVRTCNYRYIHTHSYVHTYIRTCTVHVTMYVYQT